MFPTIQHYLKIFSGDFEPGGFYPIYIPARRPLNQRGTLKSLLNVT